MKKSDSTIVNDLKEIDYRFKLEIKNHPDQWWMWRRIRARERYQLLLDNNKI